MAYSLCPDLNIRRLIVTSAYSIGSAPSVLSMVSATSARPRGAREVVPAKMTSSILPPRSDFAPCSPITHESASTTLDLPDPFGPTTQVMPGSRRRVVAEANDLKPRRVRDFRYTCPLLPRNDPAERPSLEGYRPGRPTAGKRAATVAAGAGRLRNRPAKSVVDCAIDMVRRGREATIGGRGVVGSDGYHHKHHTI